MSLSSALAAGGDFLTSTATNIYSARQAEENQRRQMRFQKRMRATQYQTQMKDMRKAGLNPILAAGANPAGVPAGSAPSSGMIGNSAGSTYVANKLANQQVKKIQQEVATGLSQQKLNQQQQKVLIETQKEVAARTEQIQNSAQGIQYDNTEKRIWSDLLNNAEFLGWLKKLGLGAAAGGAAIGGAKALNKSLKGKAPNSKIPKGYKPPPLKINRNRKKEWQKK